MSRWIKVNSMGVLINLNQFSSISYFEDDTKLSERYAIRYNKRYENEYMFEHFSSEEDWSQRLKYLQTLLGVKDE